LAGIGLACAALLTVLVRLLAARVQVAGESMAPALQDGDRLLVSRLQFLWRAPRPGEIVLADLQSVPGGAAIKRVAPAGAVVPSGRAANGWLRPGSRHHGLAPQTGRGNEQYALLGDNATASTDSRQFGAVPRAAIRAKVWYRYWPPERRGRVH
jgi:signal peptidase I